VWAGPIGRLTDLLIRTRLEHGLPGPSTEKGPTMGQEPKRVDCGPM
jgi:hypothetical protein